MSVLPDTFLTENKKSKFIHGLIAVEASCIQCKTNKMLADNDVTKKLSTRA